MEFVRIITIVMKNYKPTILAEIIDLDHCFSLNLFPSQEIFIHLNIDKIIIY